MVGLQFRNGSYRVLFRYQGKQHAFTLGGVSPDEADAKASQVDYLLMRLKQKLASLPVGVSIIDYLQFDGKETPTAVPTPEKLTPKSLRERYLIGNEASLEANTLNSIRIHFRHSFISACASKGVDQRLVEAWAGQMTTEMSRRYSHPYPSTQQEALARVFG